MKRLAASLVFVGALAMAGNAGAWGGPGHQLTGAIADQLLNPNARQHVQAILGSTLQVAAPWPDCVRSVKMTHGKLQFDATQVAAVCKVFATPAGEAEMVAYATANWSQCKDDDPSRACHAKYHFADVPEADARYSATLPGTNDHDVVHTINAAVARLEGKTPPAPFQALTDRQALFLLAHMVGDLHQPLHVGAVYLDPKTGARVDPAKPPPKPEQTQGGNEIMYTSSGVLHAAWDDIEASLGVDGKPYATEAAALPATPGDFHGWAAAWASDTVAQAHTKAFAGLDFGPFVSLQQGKKTVQAWTISSKPATYPADLHAEQRVQLIKGGRHLADLLNAIWPAQGAGPAPAPAKPAPAPKPAGKGHHPKAAVPA